MGLRRGAALCYIGFYFISLYGKCQTEFQSPNAESTAGMEARRDPLERGADILKITGASARFIGRTLFPLQMRLALSRHL